MNFYAWWTAFRPNTITYGIPVDHEIGKKIKDAQIGVVFHTSYVGDRLSSLLARAGANIKSCLLYTSPSPRDRQKSRMPSSA